MKLTEIRIDRCGLWRDTTVALKPGGLGVLYGPNEAGKSTLVQFIRGVLYGFAPQADGHPCEQAGSLVIEESGRTQRVYRSSNGTTRGTACLVGDKTTGSAQEFLTEILRGLDERAFEGAFSVDLPQLHELRALSSNEATARIYDVTFGPDGQRLLAAGRRAHSRRTRLVDPLQQDGELVRLFERHDRLVAELRGMDRNRHHHVERCEAREALAHEVAGMRERQRGIREQLRGHIFLERAWGPWRQIHDGRRELDSLPAIADFPERGLERLERIETEIAEAAEARDRLLAERRQLREQWKLAVAGSPRLALAGIMQGFVDQRPWLAGLEERRNKLKCDVEEGEQELAAALKRLGPDWTSERIRACSVTPAGWERLSGTADSLRGALRRQRALKNRRRRLVARCRELRDSLAESIHDLDGQPVESALTAARERLRQMNHLSRLQLREAELRQRQFSLLEHRERIVPQLTLPRWVYVVLGVFSFMGILLAGWGLIAGVATSGIAGAIYALLGITCGGLAVGLKTQYEGDARRRIGETDAQLATAQGDLNETRASIARLLGQTATTADGAAPREAIDGGELVRRAAERVAELVELAQHQRTWRTLRRRRDETNQKLDGARREVETARATWESLLHEGDLPESLAPHAAFETWQKRLEALAALERRDAAQTQFDEIDGIREACRLRIAEFGRRLEDWDVDYDRPVDVLAAWDGQLIELGRAGEERRDLKKKLREIRRATARQQARVAALKVQRDALLVQGGAASRDEFEERARRVARADELERRLADAERELEVVCSAHVDLALVEEDLLAYDGVENARCIETLKLEAADLDRDVQRALESLAGVSREIETIENDRTGTRLRLEIQQVRDELKDAARDWAVVELAAQAGDELRREFERSHQPAVLLAASRLFAKLTEGKYASVWAPLGERRLMVDDDHGSTLSVSVLSRGTRELLFLAVRLAVVEELARHGTRLPLILDDVFVNFDEARAAAAAQALCDFVQAGHQVLLFTCHLHLARMFQSRGIEPIWLPDRRIEREPREEQRRAG